MAPAADVVTGFGWPALSGPVAVAVLATAGAALAAAFLPRHLPLLREAPVSGPVRATSVARPLVAMVAAQLTMVAVMTMTPLQLQNHGHGLDVVGWVLSAHLFGMFALAPLSGRIATARALASPSTRAWACSRFRGRPRSRPRPRTRPACRWRCSCSGTAGTWCSSAAARS